MLFRPQRGSLAEAMAEVREFDGSWEELRALMPPYVVLVEVTPYGFDSRIEWDTYMVRGRLADASEDDLWVVGFTNTAVVRPDPPVKEMK